MICTAITQHDDISDFQHWPLFSTVWCRLMKKKMMRGSQFILRDCLLNVQSCMNLLTHIEYNCVQDVNQLFMTLLLTLRMFDDSVLFYWLCSIFGAKITLSTDFHRKFSHRQLWWYADLIIQFFFPPKRIWLLTLYVFVILEI